MTDIVDETTMIHRKVQAVLTSIENVHKQLIAQRRLLTTVERKDHEGILHLCVVEGEKEKLMGLNFSLPSDIVKTHVTSEVSRIEKELEELIGPLRALTLADPPESKLWEVICAFWGDLDKS